MRRRRNPGAEVLPWVLGIGALAGLSFVLYQQSQANAANQAAALAAANARANNAPPPDNTSQDINAATNAGQTIWGDLTSLFSGGGSASGNVSVNA